MGNENYQEFIKILAEMVQEELANNTKEEIDDENE